MIEEYTYGCFKVDGKEFLGDLMIKNNVAHYWQNLNDRKLRVSHISDLLKENPEVFVIGTGAGGLLEVGKEIDESIMDWKLNSKKKPISHIVKNVEAIKIINDAMERGMNVSAVLAGGC
jgi:hypothetical protein